MFPLKNTEAYIHANGFRSTLGKELSDRDAVISELGSEIQALTNYDANTGVKNVLRPTATTQTINGITFTVASDGTVTINDTATADAVLMFDDNSGTVKSGNYILNGLDGGSSSTILMALNYYNSQGVEKSGPTATNGDVPVTIPTDYNGHIKLYLIVKSGQTFNNKVVKPMLRPASIADPTYQPYAKTNVELTQDTTYKTGSFAAGESGFFHSLAIKQFGKVVTINGYVQNISPVGNTPLVLGTVSDVDMPPLDLRATAAIASAAYEDPSQMAYLTLTTSGELKVRCENTATNVATYFSVSYIV